MVIAKAPAPGRSKTRRCPPCSPDQAAELAGAALAAALAAVAAAPTRLHLVALEGRLQRSSPPRVEVIPELGDGLGERLGHALGAARGPALVVGMDTPQLTPDLLSQAAARLARPGVDAVVGPAFDGGYWTIGLRSPDPAAFEGVPMSSSETESGAGAAAARARPARGRARAPARRGHHRRRSRGRTSLPGYEVRAHAARARPGLAHSADHEQAVTAPDPGWRLQPPDRLGERHAALDRAIHELAPSRPRARDRTGPACRPAAAASGPRGRRPARLRAAGRSARRARSAARASSAPRRPSGPPGACGRARSAAGCPRPRRGRAARPVPRGGPARPPQAGRAGCGPTREPCPRAEPLGDQPKHLEGDDRSRSGVARDVVQQPAHSAGLRCDAMP